jgi:hypothetical protein
VHSKKKNEISFLEVVVLKRHIEKLLREEWKEIVIN